MRSLIVTALLLQACAKDVAEKDSGDEQIDMNELLEKLGTDEVQEKIVNRLIDKLFDASLMAAPMRMPTMPYQIPVPQESRAVLGRPMPVDIAGQMRVAPTVEFVDFDLGKAFSSPKLISPSEKSEFVIQGDKRAKDKTIKANYNTVKGDTIGGRGAKGWGVDELSNDNNYDKVGNPYGDIKYPAAPPRKTEYADPKACAGCDPTKGKVFVAKQKQPTLEALTEPEESSLGVVALMGLVVACAIAFATVKSRQSKTSTPRQEPLLG